MKHNWPEWIDRLGRNDVSEQDLREFQDALDASPEAKREYMESLYTEAALEAEGDRSLLQPTLSTAPQPESPPANIINLRRWALPAAASVAILLGLSYFLGSRNAPIATDTPVVAHVATITDTNKAADAAGLRIGELLRKGDISVPDGAEIGIAMHGGARLQINGPATFRIDGPEKIFLHKGRVQTYAPEYAHGFTIDTDEGKVIDLGTRFVTTTGTELGTEIHCIEGLVKAKATDAASKMTFIGGEQAAILKDGKMIDTEYLAQRLAIPLDPNLPDSDGDGVPDVIERYYGTNANDPKLTPASLRISESFDHYKPSAIEETTYQGVGKIPHWQGGGHFIAKGLTYSHQGKTLKSSGGCLETTGDGGTGAIIIPDPTELPKDGTIYISFLIQYPVSHLRNPFAGLLLYDNAHREQFFCGKISSVDSYGSRYATSAIEDMFAIPTDDQPHLFVIRLDLTKRLTDVFVDPNLSLSDTDQQPKKRYQDVPAFDRIMLRSGSFQVKLPVKFDEIRVGLTWDAVLPIE
jgi:ferric-dicitrate binding protein FerR (iron transport regulator)